ncbi:unnamed protein product [Caenorhabditis sp. 36 PRJEB53466]|nr:unnamed protein product [Caenorhabditis sp. 36 PRJEB53466]
MIIESPGSSAAHLFEASQLATKSVIVYSDRAEVKRLVTVDLPKGNQEIVIQNVSAVIERQSVRVDGRGVLIQEVQYQEVPLDMRHETDKIVDIERQKYELENERFAIDDECCSIRKRIDVLDGVAAQISSGPSIAQSSSVPSAVGSQPHLARRHTVTGQEPNPLSLSAAPMPNGFFFNHESLDNLAKFLKYYGDAVRDMKKELRKRQRETEQLSEKLDALDRQLDQLRCLAEYDSIKRYEIYIYGM